RINKNQDKAAGRRQYKWYGTDPPGASSPWGTVPFGPGRGNAVPVFVNPPYCVETPPGTRYNPPFNISENLFLTG
ncbi:TPA: hypothetical protein ACKJ4S_002203, partial [Neisseria gonorrhoeae]